MTEHENNDLRPLLPRRGLGLASWLRTPWLGFNRGYTSVSNSVSGTESESPVHQSSGVFDVEPSEANVPPVLPNGPSEPTNEDIQSIAITIESEEDEETTNRERLLNTTQQAESSTMGADRSQNSPSPEIVQEPNSRLLETASSSGVTRRLSGERICLICLEPLTDEEFAIGTAIALACDCKGDAAFRHKECAQKWVNIKGDRTCDVCRASITNLDAPAPRSEAGSNRNSDTTDGSRDRYPSPSDVFDCIRMTWVVTIVCVLFFNLDIASALVTGLLVAVMYTWLCQLIRCARFRTTNVGLGADHEVQIEVEQNQPIVVPEIIVQ